MYKYLAVLALLAGCAAAPNPHEAAFQAYVEQQRPRAHAGEIKWSEYYIGLYERAERASAPGAVLGDINKFAGYSLDHEAGKMTADEYALRVRELKAVITERQQRDQAYEAERRRSIGAAQFAAGMAMMQASQPQAPPYIAPPTPSGNAYVTGYLRNHAVNGSIKYCNYSNGAVISVASHSLCPNVTR